MSSAFNGATHRRLAPLVELGMTWDTLTALASVARIAGKEAQKADIPHGAIRDLIQTFINDARIEIMREQKNGNGA
jgi:hypothetical protein